MNNCQATTEKGPSRLMGIVNVTPDSFSDGGQWYSSQQAIEHGLQLIEDGADIIDIGGESTRPGSVTVTISEELQRVIPVIAGIKEYRPDCRISIDTRKSAVAREAIAAGAEMINDISGLTFSDDMAEVAAEYQSELVIMHMRGTPATMQQPENLCYNDVVAEVKAGLLTAAKRAETAGVRPDRIILDPGIGFAKNRQQNIALLANIKQLQSLGYPLLVGPSRKAFIGEILDIAVASQRQWGTAGAVAFLATHQVDIIRVHDVKQMAEMLTILRCCQFNHQPEQD